VSGDFRYLKSWRFWALFTGANLFLNFGSTFGYVLSDRYVARWHDKADPINSVIAVIFAILLCPICWLVFRRIYGARPNMEIVLEVKSIRHRLGIFALAVLQILPVAYIANHIIAGPFSIGHYSYPVPILWLVTILGFILAAYEQAPHSEGNAPQQRAPAHNPDPSGH
jgi:hypothetical protein